MKSKRWIILWAGRVLLFAGTLTPAFSATGFSPVFTLAFCVPLLIIFLIAWKRPRGGGIAAIVWGIYGYYGSLAKGVEYNIFYPPPAYVVFALGGACSLIYGGFSRRPRSGASGPQPEC